MQLNKIKREKLNKVIFKEQNNKKNHGSTLKTLTKINNIKKSKQNTK